MIPQRARSQTGQRVVVGLPPSCSPHSLQRRNSQISASHSAPLLTPTRRCKGNEIFSVILKLLSDALSRPTGNGQRNRFHSWAVADELAVFSRRRASAYASSPRRRMSSSASSPILQPAPVERGGVLAAASAAPRGYAAQHLCLARAARARDCGRADGRGIATPGGGRWHVETVLRMQRRLEA